MATSATTRLPVSAAAPATPLRRKCRRRISPQAALSLRILGHSIQHLADRLVHEEGLFAPRNPELEAIHLLMALNRQVYFECPEIPGLGERLRSLFHLHTA